MNKKIYKELLSIAFPAMGENLLQMMMGMVDSYLVASLGIVALSGVSIANNLLAVYQAVFIALAAAVSSQLANVLGKEKGMQITAIVTDSVKLTVYVGVFLGILAVILGPTLLTSLGAEREVAQLGGLYLILVGGSILLLGLMTCLGGILRTLGQPRYPMYISLFSNLLNAVFSAIAVFVLHTGVAGVAFGTILSRIVECGLLWSRLSISIKPSTWSVDKELVRLALPAIGERLMMRAVVIVGMITSLGTAVVAGNAIGETITQFNYMPTLGISVATLIMTAKSRQDSLAVQRIYRIGLGLSLIFMFVIGGISYLAGPSLISLFTMDVQVAQASQTVLLYSVLGVPFTAATLVFTGLWQGMGNARLPFYATGIGMWVVRIGLAYFLIKNYQLGLPSIWLATIVDNAFRASLLYVRFRYATG
ncbi:TPA: MATE family efflux transporter [Streptococcus suis]